MVYRKDWGQPMQGLQGFARTMKAFGRKVNMTTADTIGNASVIGAFYLPAGFMVLGWYGQPVPALGAGLTLSIGDPTGPTPNRYLSAAAMSGVAWPAMATTGLFFRTFSDTEVQITVTAAAVLTPGVLEFYIYGITV